MEFWKRDLTSYWITFLHYHVSFSYHEQFWSIFCRVSHWSATKIWCFSSISCLFLCHPNYKHYSNMRATDFMGNILTTCILKQLYLAFICLAHTLQMQEIFRSLESYGLMNIFPGTCFCDILPHLLSISPKDYNPMNYAMPIDIVFILAQWW